MKRPNVPRPPRQGNKGPVFMRPPRTSGVPRRDANPGPAIMRTRPTKAPGSGIAGGGVLPH